MTTSVAERRAPIATTVRLARPSTRGLVLSTALGAGCIASAIALLGTSAWLISRCAQHGSIADLGLAIVSVRFFAVSRGLFRYGERLVGHDAAFRSLAELRVRVYERLERLAPTGLHGFHRGDLLARVVRDVDTLQDVGLRVLPAWWIAGVVGLATTVALWLLLPSAAIAGRGGTARRRDRRPLAHGSARPPDRGKEGSRSGRAHRFRGRSPRGRPGPRRVRCDRRAGPARR